MCCEVKTITKQSNPQDGLKFADQVYEKVFEHIDKAREQLVKSAKEFRDPITLFVSVSNWLGQAVHLTQRDYQYIVDRLEAEQLEGGVLRESLASTGSYL